MCINRLFYLSSWCVFYLNPIIFYFFKWILGYCNFMSTAACLLCFIYSRQGISTLLIAIDQSNFSWSLRPIRFPQLKKMRWKSMLVSVQLNCTSAFFLPENDSIRNIATDGLHLTSFKSLSKRKVSLHIQYMLFV